MHISTLKYILTFVVINFAALAIGSMATTEAVNGPWYQALNKAPWTPPGWVFGAAWTMIMALYAIFMGFAYKAVSQRKKLIVLFAIQWILNVAWNPIFFIFHQTLFAFVVISALFALVSYFLFAYSTMLKSKALLVSPYFVWLLIAASLNLYVVIYN